MAEATAAESQLTESGSASERVGAVDRFSDWGIT